MEKTVLLKTQLNEASKFGKSKDFKNQRLSVILLDNFVEIQLRCLIDERLYDDQLNSHLSEKKYKQKRKIKIIKYYGELLEACVDESIISEDEKKLLLFCHDVRNNLYHKIQEEKLLVKVSLIILHKIINEKQPDWGNGLGVTLCKGKKFDPFVNKKGKESPWFNSNTNEEWEYFFKNYFNFIDKRQKSIQKLLIENIKNKIKKTRKNFKFVNKEYSIMFPYAKKWKFNEFCLYFSFKNRNNDKIEETKEDNINGEKLYKKLFDDYKRNWRKIDNNRLKIIEKQANELAKLSIIESLEKYKSVAREMNMIYDAFNSASSVLDREIQMEIDRARGN